VIFSAYKERYHTVAGCALGQDRTSHMDEFTQKLSHEELLRAKLASPGLHNHCGSRCEPHVKDDQPQRLAVQNGTRSWSDGVW
jgi:hypothetical protein